MTCLPSVRSAKACCSVKFRGLVSIKQSVPILCPSGEESGNEESRQAETREEESGQTQAREEEGSEEEISCHQEMKRLETQR